MAAPEQQLRKMNVNEMLRVSSDKQDVARQEDDVDENREQFHLNVLRTIRIKISGTLVMTHPEVQQLIKELSDPRVDGISVSAIDRLFRPKDFKSMELLQFFFDNKKVIVSTKEGIVEPWTDQGWDICMNAAQKAGAELRELKRRTKGGRKRRQAQKKMCQTTAPYGMVYVGKYERDADGRCQYLMEDPKPSSVEGISKKQVVQMVFHWRFYNRMRVGNIQTKLNQTGILTAGKKGQYEPGPWSRQTVRQMLMNRKYIGEHWEGGEMIPCPTFVEREVFEAVQKMFAAEKEMANGRPATKHLLCGWLRCKKCGRRHRTSTGAGHPSYVCGNFDYKLRKQVCKTPRVQCRLLDSVVWDTIWRHLTQADLLLANAKAYYDSLPSKASTGELEKELAAVRSRMGRTRRMVRSGAEDETTGTAFILEDKKQIAGIEAELRAAGSVMTLPPAYVVQAGCDRIAKSGVTVDTFEERRPVLEKLVDLKIVFDGETREVEIEGKVPVPEAVEASGKGDRKCNSRVGADAKRKRQDAD
jgi:DNA invertase Pin-like site-specific DNA recombinase